MPDPDGAGDLGQFVGLLGELRAWAGLPSYRMLAKRVGPFMRPARVVSPFTVVDVFKPGRRRLDLDLVVAIVRALGADEPAVDRWRQACIRVHARARTDGPAGEFGSLPTDLATFTGRHEELARLVAAATNPREGDSSGANNVVVSSIEGMAGVGKTQLAIHAAHQLLRDGHFAEIQLYVNLRGFDPDHPPADPSAVLEAFLRQLGVAPKHIPAARDERAAMYRDKLRERGGLVLLDNAADEGQVRDLVPAGPGCLVLITSRRSLAGLDGVDPYLIDVFSETESLDLLMRIAGRDRVVAEPEAAARIVDCCDHLPLAVALAAARLRSRPAWSLAVMAERLEDGCLDEMHAGGRALTPVFDLSYRDLPERLRRTFRLLGHHPGHDFTPSMVTALAEVPLREAEAALEHLQDENLVRQSTPGRYELHDLVRAYALKLAQAEPEHDAQAALTRLASWYVTAGHAAATAINTPALLRVLPDGPGERAQFGSYDEGLAWFDQEWQNITALQQAAAKAGLHRHTWQLALVQKQFRVVRNQFDDFLAVQKLAVEAAVASGDRAAEALMVTGLGGVYFRTDRLDDAERCLLEARRIYRAIGDPTGEGSALVDYGSVQTQRGNKDHAVSLYTRAIDLLQGPDGQRVLAIALMNRGVIHQRLGNLAQAVADTHLALSAFRQVQDHRNQAMAIGNLAWFHLLAANHRAALDLYRDQQQLADLLADNLLQANALMGTGETHAAAGQIDKARHAWQEAQLLYEEITHPWAAQARHRLDISRKDPTAPWTPTDWEDPESLPPQPRNSSPTTRSPGR
ncbi:tetratricopeptide repeat protein [Actinacidiphila rubida]|uniref:Predicted ATPase n=1 Tax=Actinacidiphila rubida TaxID=310780 RepID=A0A1H8NIT3_9ACTN|nr:tetratricopeptide repeat protein [Actinacidiphila rubida]SEO29507.1 Predicted ATPase [Actinacidiphila rubida]